MFDSGSHSDNDNILDKNLENLNCLTVFERHLQCEISTLTFINDQYPQYPE